MERYLIKGKDLRRFLDTVRKGVELIAPKRQIGGEVVFDHVRNADEIELDYTNPTISPRTFLFPQSDCIMVEPVKPRSSSGSGRAKEIIDRGARIVFGIRPCDMKAVNLMRQFFSDKFVDPYYIARLERTEFFVLACEKPCGENSFCDSMGAGPLARDSFDLQFISLGRDFLLEVAAEKGASATRRSRLLREAKEGSEAQIKELVINFKKLQKREVSPSSVYHIMKQDKVGDEIWRDIGIRCQTCGGCVYSCPTCSCFNIVDLSYENKAERNRLWDGCPFEGFTRMAGGANPVPERKNRIRRFFEHKLNVDYERYGRPSCVGCGRCINTCPGNINIARFMQEVLKCPV